MLFCCKFSIYFLNINILWWCRLPTCIYDAHPLSLINAFSFFFRDKFLQEDRNVIFIIEDIMYVRHRLFYNMALMNVDSTYVPIDIISSISSGIILEYLELLSPFHHFPFWIAHVGCQLASCDTIIQSNSN